MAIDKVQIKNFTVFEDIEIEFSKGVNVIIGENGTGKTHLLKLLYGSLQDMPDTYRYEASGIKLNITQSQHKFFQMPLFFGLPMSATSLLAHDGNTDMTMSITIRIDSNIYHIGEYAENGISGKSYYQDDKPTETDGVFIPAKEMLSISKLALLSSEDLFMLQIDRTLTDTINLAKGHKLGESNADLIKKIIPVLESRIEGTVIANDDGTFSTKRSDKSDPVPFSMEAEGIKKIGLLWKLIMNKSITKDTVLLWDEPEANINPKLIPDIVEILLELSRQGVQVFVATHDYIFSKYVEVKRKELDDVLFHSLYKAKNGTKCETHDRFSTLTHNDILLENIHLYEAEVKKVME